MDDVVIDVENKMFTHRPDLFGILGDARELAGIQHVAFKSPDWYKQVPKFQKINNLDLAAKIETPLVSRFMVVAIDSVKVGPSPVWLQAGLTRVGIRPINNIVDITNFVMHLTAQPLHAYDYDKVKTRSASEPVLIAREAKKAEKMTLLNGKTLAVDAPTVVIATDQESVGIGGVMGGGDTEVDDKTTRIILEVATFDMYNIRRTSMQYGLFTDAVTRFNKGQSPLQNDRVLSYAMELIEQLSGGQQASNVIDEHGTLAEPQMVRVAASFVNARLGFDLSADEMQKLLENVEFTVERTDNKEELKITPPFWRTDIEIPEDIVEEVGRLYGFDNLPLVLPSRDITPAPKDELLEFKQHLRTILSAGGANEVLTYNFVHGNLLQNAGQSPERAFRLSNALSPDLQYLRMDVLPSLMDKVHANIKAGYDEFALFEINKAHNKIHADDDGGLPTEFNMLAFVYAANDKKQRPGAAYYQARKHLDTLAAKLGLELVYAPAKELDFPVFKMYDMQRTALVTVRNTPITLGLIGEFKPSVAKAFKLPRCTAGFEVGVKELLEATTTQGRYQPLPRFPKVTQDITFKVDISRTYDEVFSFVRDNIDWPDNTLASIEPIDIYQGEAAESKHITLRVNIASYDKTLTDAEVTKLLDAVAAKAKSTLKAERL